jgi:hypothetical protein
MMSDKLLFLPLCLALAACGGIPASTGTPPEQLEPIDISGAATDNLDLSGVLSVTGSDRDFAFGVVDAVQGEIHLDVHSPGMADLTTLHGRTVSIHMPAAPSYMPTVRSVLVTDEKGPLYVGDAGYGFLVDGSGYGLDLPFGTDFIRFGEPVATVYEDLGANSSGYEEKGYGPLIFKTDKGDVSVAVGEVTSIAVGGALYRVSVIGSIKVQYHTDEEVNCGEGSTISFEMLRVDAAPSPLKLTRPPHLDPVALGCIEP